MGYNKENNKRGVKKMTSDRFYEIGIQLQSLKTNKDKIAYLKSVIEPTDFEDNGFNKQLINKLNEFIDLDKNNGDNQ